MRSLLFEKKKIRGEWYDENCFGQEPKIGSCFGSKGASKVDYDQNFRRLRALKLEYPCLVVLISYAFRFVTAHPPSHILYALTPKRVRVYITSMRNSLELLP